MFNYVVLFTVFGSSLAFATVPIVDCNNNINCQNQESWEEYNSLAYKKDNCIVNPRFRINKCCVGATCSYVIDLVSVTVVGTCTEPISEIKKDALKFIFSKLPELVNAPQFTNFDVHVKIPKCMTYHQYQWFSYFITEIYACEPDDCCLAVYNVAALGNYGVRIMNQYPYQNNYITCTGTVGGCDYACDNLDFTPDLPFDINFNDFSGELCELDCFWRLDGNTVNTESYIGTNNHLPLRIKTMQGQDIIFSTNDIPKMWLKNNGRLNIGNNYENPGEQGIKLAVAGKIIAEELIIRLYASWPDYVFEDGHNRLSFADLEKYIQTHKSLPGVPKASEMNNLEVGKIMPIMLEKIEELTLYLLELKKENEQLKVKIDELGQGK